MSEAGIDAFGRDLMQLVRDRAIANCDALLSPQANSRMAHRWKHLASKEQIAALVPDIVDQTLFALLLALDNDELRLRYQSDGGTEIDLTVGGRAELAGWFAGSPGWRNQFSSARFVDDQAEEAAGR